MIKIHLWPFGYRGAFAVRDDDISYFTTPDMLKKVYDGIWSKIPISFSVIPYHKAIGERTVPPEFRNNKTLYTVNANEDLFFFLQKILKEGKADILLHGNTHENFDGNPEFCSGNYFTLRERVRKGRDLLESIFHRKVRVFVPPHNSMSRAGASAVIKEKMDIARCCSYMQAFRTVATPQNVPILVKLFLRNPAVHKYPLSPRLIFFRTHIDMQQSYMFASDLLKNNSLTEMKREFHKAVLRNDLFYITVHYWDFYEHWVQPNWRMLETFNSFLNFVLEQRKVWFTTLDKVSEWCEHLRSLTISREDGKVKIESRKDINGLTITTTDRMMFNCLSEEVEPNTFVLNLKKGESLTILLK